MRRWWHFAATFQQEPCPSTTSIFTEHYLYEGEDPPFPPEPERIELMAYPTVAVQSPVPVNPSTSGSLVTSFTVVIS